jgi:(p)ppGpp synthase/HD superfamily hydrolase
VKVDKYTGVDKARVFEALHVATTAHGAINHRRKYTNDPYIVHPISVGNTIYGLDAYDPNLHMASLLHDVIEDTKWNYKHLFHLFGKDVADLVNEVTDVSINHPELNRKARKNMDKDHLALASDRAKSLKLADLIDNSESIVKHDKKFAKVYMKEKADLLLVLKGGDTDLYAKAYKIVNDWNNGDPKKV